MANTCISSYKITGSPTELHALYSLMQRMSKEKENGNWVGHIVDALCNNETPPHLYLRGWWSNLIITDYCLSFDLESAWTPLEETWDFICSKTRTLSAYFMGEEPGCGVYLKRDNDKYNWFPYNFVLEALTPEGDMFTEYFVTIDEAFRYIEKIADVNIITADDIEALNLTWGEEDEDAYIFLNEFKEV